jgi:hypothetical protein
MYDYTITSGFLIEKTFARMCREYLTSLAHGWPHLLGKRGYSVPRRNVPPEQMPKQYRGLHREPIQGWVEGLRGSGVVEPTDQELEASCFLKQLDREGRSDNDFILDLVDAKKLMEMIDPPVEREIIWARIIDEGDPPPAEIGQDDPILTDTVFLGYDLSAFYPPNCSSAIAESMFFTWWLCDDEKRLRFAAHHEKLNKWGLFDAPTDAEEFLLAYLRALAPDADELGYGHRIVEVRALP